MEWSGVSERKGGGKDQLWKGRGRGPVDTGTGRKTARHKGREADRIEEFERKSWFGEGPFEGGEYATSGHDPCKWMANFKRKLSEEATWI